MAISAALNQENKPVAFFLRNLNSNERHRSIIEKEATAIVEALKKRSHFLQERRFKMITDHKSVSFMYDNKRRSKVKNDKILELSLYDYEMIYGTGKYNSVSDTLSRAYCISVAQSFFFKFTQHYVIRW